MNIYCTVSIDTECDQGSHWKLIKPMRFTSITDLIPHTLQKVFLRHNVRPTYLLSPEVLEDRSSVEVLRSLSNVELGSHLHGEFVEPFKKPVGDSISDFQAMYSPEIEAAKLANLTRRFEEKIGFKPRCFRAGRWGISPHSFKILEDLGYLVDSSVTPYFIWKFPEYSLNYKIVPDAPYFPSMENFMAPGNMRLLQVPVTLFSQYGSFLNRYSPHWPRSARKILTKLPLWRPVWLRPTFSDYQQMKYVIDSHIDSHRDEEDIVLNMMFHSVEILPDENPYNFDKDRIRVFLESMEETFDYLLSRGAHFAGLSDVYPIFEKKRSKINDKAGSG
jgi:hypothetical protein